MSYEFASWRSWGQGLKVTFARRSVAAEEILKCYAKSEAPKASRGSGVGRASRGVPSPSDYIYKGLGTVVSSSSRVRAEFRPKMDFMHIWGQKEVIWNTILSIGQTHTHRVSKKYLLKGVCSKSPYAKRYGWRTSFSGQLGYRLRRLRKIKYLTEFCGGRIYVDDWASKYHLVLSL